MILAGNVDGQINLLKSDESKSFQKVHTFCDHGFGVWDLDTKENLMISASDDLINLSDLTACKRTLSFSGHKEPITSICFDQNAYEFVTGSMDWTIKLWDMRSGKCKQTLTSHSDIVWSVKYSPDSKLLVSGSEDGQLIVHRLDAS